MANVEFNKAEALRRHKEGEKVTEIAKAMGVTKTDIYSAIRELKREKEWDVSRTSALEADIIPPANEVPGAVPELSELEAKPAPKRRGRKKKAAGPAEDAVESTSVTGNVPADVEEFVDSAEAWAERKIGEEDTPRSYIVKLKDGTELIIAGVAKVSDGWNTVTFSGNGGKAIVVSAAELMYYYPGGCKTSLGVISVD